MADYKEILRNNIKERRKDLGFTQSQLAEMLEVEDKYISRIETGAATPSFALLGRLAEVLQVTPNELFTPDDKIERENIIKEINEKLCNINKEKLNIISKMVDLVIN